MITFFSTSKNVADKFAEKYAAVVTWDWFWRVWSISIDENYYLGRVLTAWMTKEHTSANVDFAGWQCWPEILSELDIDEDEIFYRQLYDSELFTNYKYVNSL